MLDNVATAIAAIAAAGDQDELRAALQSAVRRLGFQSYNLSYNKTDVRQFMQAPTLSSWSSADLDAYHRDGWADRDPLLARAGNPDVREVWAAADWAACSDTREYAEYLAAVGIRWGATASIAGRPDTVGAITALSMTGTPAPQVGHSLYAIGQAGALKATTLGIECLDIPAASSAIGSLTGRQKEILDWAGKGKSNRDIAEILGCSKRSVDYHMSEILGKLEVSSRTQAIILYSGEK